MNFFLCGIFVFRLLIGANTGAHNAGFVVAVDGQWLVGNTPVKQGQALAPGSSIHLRAQPAHRHARIRIALLNGVSLSQSCSNPSLPCATIYIPQSLAPQSSLLKRLIEAVGNLMGRTSQRFASALTRYGQHVLVWSDNVLPLRDQQIDLASELQGLPAGSYQVVLRRINPSTGKTEAQTTALKVNWNADDAAPVSSLALRSGLYQIGNAAKESTGLVLLVDPANFAEARSAFEGAVKYTQSWKSPKETDVQAFQRAALTQLAIDFRYR